MCVLKNLLLIAAFGTFIYTASVAIILTNIFWPEIMAWLLAN